MREEKPPEKRPTKFVAQSPIAPLFYVFIPHPLREKSLQFPYPPDSEVVGIFFFPG